MEFRGTPSCAGFGGVPKTRRIRLRVGGILGRAEPREWPSFCHQIQLVSRWLSMLKIMKMLGRFSVSQKLSFVANVGGQIDAARVLRRAAQSSA